MAYKIGMSDAQKDNARKEAAFELGLSEDATWRKISAMYSEIARRKVVAHAQLPKDASWPEIHTNHLFQKSEALRALYMPDLIAS